MKIFYFGKQLHDKHGRFTSIKEGIRSLVQRLIYLTKIAAVLACAVGIGYLMHPDQLHAENAQVITIEKMGAVPVLERIAKCESKSGHYAPSGQVVMSANTNGTVDVGQYQINTVWFKKATELGLDITKPEDNKKMAEWIYKNVGTGPWSASSNCWNK